MLSHILPLVPKHHKYAEMFAGGLALYFAKKKSRIEIINDINRNVANFYRVLKTDFDNLMREIELALHCKETYIYSKEIYHNPEKYSNLERAWALWVTTVMSMFGKANGTFSYISKGGLAHHRAMCTRNRREQFGVYKGRLESTIIHSEKAEYLIPKLDHAHTFFYCDPPYVGANQGHYKGYNQNDFDALLLELSKIKGKFILSSYRNESLAEFSKKNGWNTIEVKKVSTISNYNKEKIEVITYNYELENTSHQLEIF